MVFFHKTSVTDWWWMVQLQILLQPISSEGLTSWRVILISHLTSAKLMQWGMNLKNIKWSRLKAISDRRGRSPILNQTSLWAELGTHPWIHPFRIRFIKFIQVRGQMAFFSVANAWFSHRNVQYETWNWRESLRREEKTKQCSRKG